MSGRVHTWRFDATLVLVALLLFAGSFGTGISFIMIFALASLIALAAFAEANREKVQEKIALSIITFLACLLLYDFIFRVIGFEALLFATLGVPIALFSKGHIARSLVLSMLAAPILIVFVFPDIQSQLGAQSLLSPLETSAGSVFFAIIALVSMVGVFFLNAVPSVVFRLTRVGYLSTSRLSATCVGLYWTNAIMLYLWLNASNTALPTSLVAIVCSWTILVVLLVVGAGYPSRIVIGKLILSARPSQLPKVWLASLTISASIYSLMEGEQVEFTGMALDQNNDPMNASTSLWLIVDGMAVVTASTVPGGHYSISYRFLRAGPHSVNVSGTSLNQAPISSQITVRVQQAPQPPGPRNTYSVKIVVIDNDSQESITGAQVSLDGKTLLTGTDGTVTFKRVPPGMHNLVATAGKYQQTTIPTSISSDLSLEVKLTALEGPLPKNGRHQEAPPNENMYVEVFQKLSEVMLDPVLAGGKVELDSFGLPHGRAGGAGIVFKVESPGVTYAVKCFTTPNIWDLEDRYSKISRYIGYGENPYLMGFWYKPNSLRVNRSLYPVLSMEWVRGKSLGYFVEDNYQNPTVMRNLARAFLESQVWLRNNEIAHGDLSDSNIMVESPLGIKLIDYDGMYVRGISRTATERGHPNYQHPLRADLTRQMIPLDFRIDNFSILVIYLSLTAIAENKGMWDEYHADQQLIMGSRDYLDRTSSRVLKDLQKSSSSQVKSLCGLLVEAIKHHPLWEGIDPQVLESIG